MGPLLGQNSNIPYKGAVYHVQTEDSGVKRPHIFTHCFADGGRVIASNKRSYEDMVGTPAYPAQVVALMREEHAAMIKQLKGGELDKALGLETPQEATQTLIDAAPPSMPQPHPEPPDRGTNPEIDLDALEKAAEKLMQASPLFRRRKSEQSTAQVMNEAAAQANAPGADTQVVASPLATPEPAPAPAPAPEPMPEAAQPQAPRTDGAHPPRKRKRSVVGRYQSGSMEAVEALTPDLLAEATRVDVQAPAKVEVVPQREVPIGRTGGPPPPPPPQAFGRRIRERTLDEVILSYLDDDTNAE